METFANQILTIQWLILLLFLVVFVESESNKSYSINLDDFQISVGESEKENSLQKHHVHFDYTTSELLVNDLKCGEKLHNCKSYCNDNILNKIFCSPICTQLNQQNYDIYCPSKKKNANDVSGDQKMSHNFVGRFEQNQIHLFDGKMSNQSPFISAKGVRFFSGVLVDKLVLPLQNITIIGLVPSPNNLFIQLHQQGLISTPQITFNPTKNGSKILKIGSIEQNMECKNWVYQSLLTTQDLVINVHKIRVFGLEFGSYLVLIDNKHKGISLPSKIRQKLIDQNVLLVDLSVSKDFYLLKCNQFLQFSLQLNSKSNNFDPSILLNQCHNKTHSISSIELPKNETNLIVLGQKFVDSTCHGIDYASGRMAFGSKTEMNSDDVDSNKCECKMQLHELK